MMHLDTQSRSKEINMASKKTTARKSAAKKTAKPDKNPVRINALGEVTAMTEKEETHMLLGRWGGRRRGAGR